MTTKSIGALVIGIFAILGALSFVGLGVHPPTARTTGSTGNLPEVYTNGQWLAGGVQIGTTGTQNANQMFGTCSLIGSTAAFAATTTKTYDCAVPGVKSVDYVFGEYPQAVPQIAGGIAVINAWASTTPGYITFSLVNLTGASTSTLPVTGWEYVTWR